MLSWQLSQRNRAMLRVIEYFAKSLKVTQVIRNDTLEWGTCKSCAIACRNVVLLCYVATAGVYIIIGSYSYIIITL